MTGFGLLGHALEMARGSNATLVLRPAEVAFLSQAAELARQGFFTGASVRNWASYGSSVTLTPNCPDWQRYLLTDPQTSGGLLVACAADRAEAIVHTIVSDNYPSARIIGRVERGEPSVRLQA